MGKLIAAKRLKRIMTSVWTWLVLLSLVALVSTLMFRAHVSQAGRISAVLMDPPRTEFVFSTRGIISVEGGPINLSANRTGVFESVLVGEGDTVVSGQVLAVQDDQNELIALENAELALNSARILLERSVLELEISRKDAERGLQQRVQDAISIQEQERREMTVRRNEMSVRAQENSVASSLAAFKTAQLNQAQRKLRSPVDGKVVKINISPGSGVSAQNVSTAIVIAADADRIVRVAVRDVDIGKVFLGQTVQVQSPPGGEKGDSAVSYDGQVVSIAEVFSAFLEQTAGVGGVGEKPGLLEVVINVGDIPLRLGQEVLVQFRRADETSTER